MVSTGQGILGNNMFAYCRNNPVCRIDISGTADADCLSENPVDDEELIGLDTGGGGPSLWETFTRSMQSAANGLNMAAGQRNYPSSERHHVLSNKSKTYTPQYKEIADRYNMSLNDKENIVALDGHKGRHTTAYHNFMLDTLINLDTLANGDIDTFYTGFQLIVEFLKENPWLPYAR